MRYTGNKGSCFAWGGALRLANCRWDECDACDEWDIVNAGSWLFDGVLRLANRKANDLWEGECVRFQENDLNAVLGIIGD